MASTGTKTGILLGQIGTPLAPTPKALRAYLRAFLSDPRVIDMHPLLWKPILHGIVLRTRPRHVAKMYGEIWTPDGSPLMMHSKRIAAGLEERLGSDYAVALGMAYSSPSIPDAVAELEKAGADRLLVFPLFPQFSTATSAAVFDAAAKEISGRDGSRIRRKPMPEVQFVPSFYASTEYQQAVARRVRKTLDSLPMAPDLHIITFHGLPARYVEEGDPYQEQCEQTAAALAREMGWKPDEWTIAFQSRFGREKWLSPYMDAMLRSLPSRGVKRPCIIPLSFVADCLETLHELGILGRRAFAESGGNPESYTLVPCLNDDPEWLDGLAAFVRSA